MQTGRVLGSAILLSVLAWVVNWAELGRAFAHIDWRLWFLAVGVLVGAQVISSWRWLLLARVLHFGGSLWRFVAYYFIGMLFNLVLPTTVGGDMMRSWYLASQETTAEPVRGKSSARRLEAFLTVFADRFTGVLVLLVLACVATALCPVHLPRYITGSIAGIGAGAVTGLVLLIWLARTGNGEPTPGVPDGILGWVRQWGPVQRMLFLVRRYWYRRDVLLEAMGLSVLVQLASVQTAWLVAHSLGMSIPWLYLGLVIPVVSLVTLLPISVNGVGLRAASLVVLLQPIGVAPSTAVTLSLLLFALTVAVSLAAGLSCYLFGRFPRLESSQGPKTVNGPAPTIPVPAAWEDARDENPVRGNPDQRRKGQPPAAA